MKMLRLNLGVVLLPAALLLLGGCLLGDSGGPAEKGPVVPVDADQERVVEPTLEEEEEVKYSYNSIGKRDPFRSFIQKEVVVSHDGGPLGPLQLHEVDTYKLTGVESSSATALVKAPDGQGHVVTLGTLIGRNWGKVTEIRPNELVITEEYRDPIENELIIHEVKMVLRDPAQQAK